MKLSIVIIGDEILLGQVTDTNTGAIARTFEPDGWRVVRVLTIGDNADDIFRAVEDALDSADLVITTGGLGPTKDDITKTVMTRIFGGELVRDESVAENIAEVFRRRHLVLNPLTEAQAMVPDSCRVVQNRYGTAPIMWFERAGKVLVAMPGVPFETEGMLPEVAARVKRHFAPSQVNLHGSVIVGGITESDLAARLDTFERALPPYIHLAYLPRTAHICLRLDAVADAVTADKVRSRFDAAFAALKELIKSYLIYEGDASPAKILIDTLTEKGLTMAAAESCTGGNISHEITSVAGSSSVFLGAIVSYANEVKTSVLGVNAADIERYGAVSREVVEQMALGACARTGADCAVATSGIAGPGGGSAEKPVGTVWIGWCVAGHVDSALFHFPGNRLRVIRQASARAVLGLVERLKNNVKLAKKQ